MISDRYIANNIDSSAHGEADAEKCRSRGSVTKRTLETLGSDFLAPPSLTQDWQRWPWYRKQTDAGFPPLVRLSSVHQVMILSCAVVIYIPEKAGNTLKTPFPLRAVAGRTFNPNQTKVGSSRAALDCVHAHASVHSRQVVIVSQEDFYCSLL